MHFAVKEIMKKNFLLILFIFVNFEFAQAVRVESQEERTYQMLFDNLCDIEQKARIENAPRTRSARAVLPNRPPPQLEESPLEFVRRLEKISAKDRDDEKFKKRHQAFQKIFWENFEKNGNVKADALKVLAKTNEFQQKDFLIGDIHAKCALENAERMRLLSEIQN